MKTLGSSTARETANRIFDLDSRIRWVGIAKDNGEVLFCEMRPGVKSLSPPEKDQEFVSFGALVVLSIFEKFVTDGGKIHGCGATFDKMHLLVFRAGDHIITISLEVSVNPEAVGEIGRKVRQIAAR